MISATYEAAIWLHKKHSLKWSLQHLALPYNYAILLTLLIFIDLWANFSCTNLMQFILCLWVRVGKPPNRDRWNEFNLWFHSEFCQWMVQTKKNTLFSYCKESWKNIMSRTFITENFLCRNETFEYHDQFEFGHNLQKINSQHNKWKLCWMDFSVVYDGRPIYNYVIQQNTNIQLGVAESFGLFFSFTNQRQTTATFKLKVFFSENITENGLPEIVWKMFYFDILQNYTISV